MVLEVVKQRNALLLALSTEALERLRPHMEEVSLALGDVLY